MVTKMATGSLLFFGIRREITTKKRNGESFRFVSMVSDKI